MEKRLGSILLVLLGVFWILKRYKDYFRSVILALRLPGPPALPLLGNVLEIRDSKALLTIGTNVCKHCYGPLSRGWMFFVPIIIVYEPEHLKIILNNTKISDKNFFYRIMLTFLGDGLITSTGNKWRNNRKLIQPLFQINFLENYFEDFAQVSQQMIANLSGQNEVQMTKIINTCVLNILHKTILGINLKDEDESPFRKSELLILKRVLKPWLLWDCIFKYSDMSKSESSNRTNMHNYVKKIFDERVSQKKSKDVKSCCFLDRLIDFMENGDISEENILNETVTFMLAGQDSVGSAMAFCLYYLAKYPEIQEKVYREINEIIYGDPRKSIEIGQINQMHYLEQVIKETLRLTPSVPIVARKLLTDVTLGKWTIPRGTNIFISPFITHRLPHVFPDPLKFDPDRFSPENLRKIHPYGFIPFSIGPRNCIGYKFAYIEMKTLIASILKNFHLVLRDESDDVMLGYRVTLRAKGGILLKLRPRNGTYVD